MFSKWSTRIFRILVLLSLYLAGCASQPQGVVGQPDQAAPTAGLSLPKVAEIAEEKPVETPTSVVVVPTPTTFTSAASAAPGQLTPPPLFYIQESRLLKLIAGEAPQPVADLPEAGPVKNAIQAWDTLLVLREQGIQRVNLVDGSIELVLRLDAPVLFGDFVLAGGSQVLYSVVVDDPGAEFGFRTFVGIYQADGDRLQPVLSLPQNLRVLGLTPDGRGLYLLPIGQDPEFGSVYLVDLEGDQVLKELPVEGSLYASLAPDGRLFATAAQRCLACDQPEGVVNLYDLPSLPLTPPRTLALPQSPSHVSGLFWSPDGSSLYFLLVPGNVWDEPLNSYGLWRLDVASGDTSQVAPVDEAAMHIRSLSPDGQWLLLEHESKPDAILVNLSSGAAQIFSRPEAALVAAWR